jgi:DNA-binding transcriptional LysR family regulator
MTTSLDDLVSMAMFARVVEAKSFTAAALKLSVSKSVVSKRVAALEERLGARLLHRTTRRLSLTTEGARIYDRCLHMLRAVDEAADQVQVAGDEPRGVLRVNSPAILADGAVADAVAAFVARYPQVAVELSADNAVIDLISERVDVALRLSSRLDSSSLVARRLATSSKVVCAAPAYLRARGTPRVPDDLRGHACLRFSPLRPEIEWRFGGGRTATVVPVSGPITSDSAEVLRRAAIAGAGIIVLPMLHIVEDLEAGRLVPVLDDHPVASIGVFAVYARGRFVPAKVRKFVDLLVTVLRDAPWDEAVQRRHKEAARR